MSIDASNEFNSSGVFATLRRSFTLKRSKNRFSLNPENSVAQKAESILNENTFKRSSSNTTGSSQSRNWTQTLGRPIRLAKSLQPVSALGEGIKKFSGDGISNEYFPEKTHSQKDTSFVKTLKRNVSMLLPNLKKPEEINNLEKAKEYFQVTKYKESKKFFENFLGSEHLKSEEKISETSLYLAAIYLLEGDGAEAKKYLEEITNGYLKLLMREHAEHLLDLQKKDIPFPKIDFYVIENGSENEKIVVEKLFKECIKAFLKNFLQNPESKKNEKS